MNNERSGRFPVPAVHQLASLLFLPLFLLHASQGDDADKLLRMALEHHRSGNFSIAKALCRQILDEYPHYVDARNLYARITAFEGNYRQALIQYDSALVYDKNSADARFGKAQVLAWSDKYGESIKLLEQLVEEKPEDVTYLVELGKVKLWNRDAEQSYRIFQRAFGLDSTSQEITRGAARAAKMIKRKDESLEWYQRLLSLNPFDPEGQYEIRRISFSARNEFQLQLSNESFSPATSANHTIFGGEYYLELDENWKPYVHVNRVKKFGESETRAGAGIYGLLTPGASFFGQVLFSPSATTIPQLDATFEFSRTLFSRFEGVFGYRYLAFASSKVVLLIPGVTLYLSDRSWVTSKGYFGNASDGSQSSALLAQAFYRLGSSAVVRVGGFLGDEAFRATTLSEIVAFHSSGVLGAIKVRWDENLGLEALYQFTSRSSASDSHLITLSFSLYY